MNNKNILIGIIMITIILLSGTAQAYDWNLARTSTFTGLNSTNLNVSGVSYFNGNVGIGTASPSNNLEVRSTSGTQLKISYSDTYYTIYGHNIIDTHTNDLAIKIDNSEKMRIATNGNVGIGTASPTSKLHVNNVINIDDGAASGTRTSGTLLMGASSTLGASISANVTGYNDVVDMVFKTTAASGTITERMRITSTGNVGIGTTNTTSRLQVGDSGDGTMTWANSWNVYSSENYKENIQDISVNNVLSNDVPLRPVSYEQKNDPNNTKMYGFIAEELPEGVKVTDGANIGINIMALVALQADKINKLETKVKEQHNVNIDQQNQINTLIYEVELLKGNTKAVKPETIISDVIITEIPTKPWYQFW